MTVLAVAGLAGARPVGLAAAGRAERRRQLS
jgi:hypothetical protein